MSPAIFVTFLLAVVSMYQVQLCHGQASTTPSYNGTWHSHLGANITITLNPSGFLQGQYFIGEGGVPVVGLVNSPAGNSTFGFSALFVDHYVMTYNGEYKVCNGVHVLLTTFTFKTSAETCAQSAGSTRIGTECFTRFRQVPTADEPCPTDQHNPCNSPC